MHLGKLIFTFFLVQLAFTACSSSEKAAEPYDPVTSLNDRFRTDTQYPTRAPTGSPDRFFKSCSQTAQGNHVSKSTYFCQ